MQAVLTALLSPFTGNGSGLLFIEKYLKFIARIGNFTQSQHLHRKGRRGTFYAIAAIVDHGTHLAQHRSRYQHITYPKSAVLHQEGSYGTSGFVEVCLNDRAFGRAIGVGVQVLYLSDQQDHF